MAMAACAFAVGACAAAAPAPSAPLYLTSQAYRRAEMAASLVNPENEYSRRRLAYYSVDGPASWDALPIFNPRTAAIAVSELDAPGGVNVDAPLAPTSTSTVISALATEGDVEALRALGEDAFFHYPVQLEPSASVALGSREKAAQYGLYRDDVRGVGGLVRVELGDGSRAIATTCSSCHAGIRNGTLTVGVGNDRLDLGRMIADASTGLTPARVAPYLAWGPGRLDVTTSQGIEPVRIPDLRPVRFLTHLHHDGTLQQRNLTTLAIRLETLIVTSNGASVRPPREIALGLATYLWSLGEQLPLRAPKDEPERRGMTLFKGACARCHAPPNFTGPPIPLAVVGTDPRLGRSPDRTTGSYRVPSLRGVATRGLLLHDGSLPSLDAMFDPSRTVPGHSFGLDLDDAGRSDLLRYLRTL